MPHAPRSTGPDDGRPPIYPQCFACRVMRSFALTGLGAAVAGFAALGAGASRETAAYWALAGGLVMVFGTLRPGGRSPTG